MTRRLLLSAALAFTASLAHAQDTTPPLETLTINDSYTVGIAHFEEAHVDVLMVIQDSYDLVWAQSGFILQTGDSFHTPVPSGTDITGDGVADMVLLSYSGGAHCCSTYYIFAFEPFFRQLAVIETQDSGARFESKPGLTGLAMITGDNTFAYWNTYYAASPAPEVILAWNGTTYAPATDLMAAPAPTADALSKKAADVAASDQWTATDMDPDLWREMLDLIYSGHADLAWTFLDEGWPAGRDGKDTFKTNFRCQLATSPYWNVVAAMNGLDPSDTPADCSGNTGG
jgi:hypothetical protein